LCADDCYDQRPDRPCRGHNFIRCIAVPACDGVYNIIRLSEITPGGSLEKFMAATAAHKAWYASHGYPDVIFAARILVRDPKTGAFSYSDKQVLSYHYTKSAVPPASHDAAWDAYVKMYRETSTIKSTYVNCVPAAHAPASLK
jgi:hypothetical protein